IDTMVPFKVFNNCLRVRYPDATKLQMSWFAKVRSNPFWKGVRLVSPNSQYQHDPLTSESIGPISEQDGSVSICPLRVIDKDRNGLVDRFAYDARGNLFRQSVSVLVRRPEIRVLYERRRRH